MAAIQVQALSKTFVAREKQAGLKFQAANSLGNPAPRFVLNLLTASVVVLVGIQQLTRSAPSDGACDATSRATW